LKSTNKKKPKRGSILVTLLFLICVLALLVATVANDSLQTLKTVSQSGRDTQAKYAAYAGMELVMNKLRTEDRYIGEPIAAPNHGRKTGTLSELSEVTYEVLIWNNMRDEDATGPPEDPIVAAGGVNVQPDTVYMISTGQDTVRSEEVIMTSMAGTARRVRPVFEDAAYARSKMILMGDSLVDAWDSGGGWTDYVAGDFPGDPPSTGSGSTGGAGGSGGGGGGWQDPTVEDHKATLGTDSQKDRTLRMLGGSRLNGHYRIGPGVTNETAFSDDSGTTSTTSGGSRTTGGSTTTAYGVSTAVDPVHQIAGAEGGTPGVLGDTEYFKLDDKSTEMPRFTAPYDSDDLEPPPVLNNSSSSYQVPGQGPGNPPPVTVHVPPAPVDVPPGGYQSINVPDDQTLRLSPGVYYFHEEMRVSGKLEVSGNDPVIIFIGKKAVFNDAEINKEGSTSSLQLCFTDEEKDPLELDALVTDLLPNFELPTVSGTTTSDDGAIGGGLTTATSSASATTLEAYVRRIIAPLADPTDPASQEGASVLEMNGGELHGSISGKNLVVKGQGGEIFGGVMANVFRADSTDIHQDLALKGSNLMNAGGWALEGVHQLR
jgi:hypothetical protein